MNIDLTSEDFETVANTVAEFAPICMAELILHLADHRGTVWWRDQLSPLAAHGILVVERGSGHPFVCAVKRCVLCGWDSVEDGPGHSAFAATNTPDYRHTYSVLDTDDNDAPVTPGVIPSDM